MPIEQQLLIALLPLTVGTLGLRLLIWLIRGKEAIIITPTELVVRRTGTFLLFNKRIPINQIKGFKVYESLLEEANGHDFELPFFGRPAFGIHNRGRLIILYGKYDSHRALNRLSYNEGIELTRQLTKLLQDNGLHP